MCLLNRDGKDNGNAAIKASYRNMPYPTWLIQGEKELGFSIQCCNHLDGEEGEA